MGNIQKDYGSMGKKMVCEVEKLGILLYDYK